MNLLLYSDLVLFKGSFVLVEPTRGGAMKAVISKRRESEMETDRPHYIVLSGVSGDCVTGYRAKAYPNMFMLCQGRLTKQQVEYRFQQFKMSGL